MLVREKERERGVGRVDKEMKEKTEADQNALSHYEETHRMKKSL